MSNQPLTFLFTDIEGSTRLWEFYPDAMAPIIARHDTLLRHIIEEHGGRVFKTIGDAVCAVFKDPAAGLAAARAAQQALLQEDWGIIGQLRVRMALHTGVAVARDGDYFGPSLNHVARLLSAGHGGQILLSLTTQEQVREQLPPDATLRDMGERRLKDLRQPEHIFQFVAAELPTSFPPLKTLDMRPTNLPAQPTACIGRKNEITAVCAQLRRQSIRLLTLSGPGGTGKTRLGQEVATKLLDEFADGVCYVPLSAVKEARFVMAAIAHALNLKETGDRDVTHLITDHLADKEMLLLLDNFEQVVDAASKIAALLTAAPRLKILITSRELLQIYGEHNYPVPPLALPDTAELPPAATLNTYPAVALFVARAQAARPDFRLTEENKAAVVEICRRLDGLPLAIELAAARSKLFTPQAMLSRLNDRLQLLVGGARDLPARQQTLRGAIAWSYDMLSADERALFARLAVFRGPISLTAAETVCGEDELDVLNHLLSLVNKSLLRETADDPSGNARFEMLETIHEYAFAQLAISGTSDHWLGRHAEYFCALAETAAPQLKTAAQITALNLLEAEHDNLRSALRWARGMGDTELALRLAAALWRFWLLRGYLSEGSRWLDAMLTLAATAAEEPPLPQLAAALHGAGVLAVESGQREKARILFEESLARSEAIGNEAAVAATLNELGFVALLHGEYARALDYCRSSLARFQALGDKSGSASALNNIGFAALSQGDSVAAAHHCRESLELFQALGDRWGTALALNNLGLAALPQGNYEEANALVAQSVALFQSVSDRNAQSDTVAAPGAN